MKLFVGYSKAPRPAAEQLGRITCHSHTMTNTGMNQRIHALLDIGLRITPREATVVGTQ